MVSSGRDVEKISLLDVLDMFSTFGAPRDFKHAMARTTIQKTNKTLFWKRVCTGKVKNSKRK